MAAGTKKIKYKPDIKSLVRRQAVFAAKDVVKVEKIVTARKVQRMVIRGKSYDEIAAKLNISAKEALDITKDLTTKWLSDEALDASALRELELRRLDSLFQLAMHEAFPHPKLDDVGRPMTTRNCDCSDDPEDQAKPCFHEAHNVPVMTSPSKRWAEFALKISHRRSAMVGLDSADKLAQEKLQTLERLYKGVSAQTIENI